MSWPNRQPREYWVLRLRDVRPYHAMAVEAARQAEAAGNMTAAWNWNQEAKRLHDIAWLYKSRIDA